MTENRAPYVANEIHLCKVAWNLYYVWLTLVQAGNVAESEDAWNTYKQHRRECADCKEAA